MSAPTIEAAEVAEVFRQAIRGEIAVQTLGGQTWDEAWCGNVQFRFGDWRITFFNDCDELDYTDSVIAPDGRECDPEAWSAAHGGWLCPIDLLTMEEHGALEMLIEKAPRA